VLIRSLRFVNCLALPALLLASACGSGEPDQGSTSNGGESQGGGRVGPDGLAEPRFVFKPANPGRAVGIRGIVTIDGQELTTAPIELRLLSSNEIAPVKKRAPLTRNSSSSSSGLIDKAGLPCPEVGSSVSAMGTINGNICYLNLQYAQGQLGQQLAGVWSFYFGAEGIYGTKGVNVSQYVPPDLASAGVGVGVGCLPGDGDGVITTEYLSKLRSLSIAFGVFFYSFGISVFTIPGHGPVRGLQHDAGLSVSIGGLLGFVPVPVNFQYSIQLDPPPDRTMAPATATFLRAWPRCSDSLGDANALEYAGDRLTEMQSDAANDMAGALAADLAANAQPLLTSLSNAGFGKPGLNVPAASTADFFAEFLSRSGTEPIDDAVNTSADGLESAFVAASLAAGDDPMSLAAAAASTIAQVNRSLPSVVGEAAQLNEAEASAQAGAELSDLAERDVADNQRFVASEIRRMVVQSGEKAHIELRSQEVADLISRPLADVVGATVHVGLGGGMMGDSTFTLGPDGLAVDVNVARDSLLVRFDVDLSTAAGDFPPDVSQWLVRPALVSIRVEPGPATAAFVAGPPAIASGAPASLSVQVLDDNGRVVKRPYSVRFVDSEGRDLGISESEAGTAMMQYVPEASVPRIDAVVQTTINYQGEKFPGLDITGVSFSEDVEVSIDGAALKAGTDYQVQGPEELLLILPDGVGPGSHSLVVRNPEGVATSPTSFSVSGL
jgi:hypothetical protein